MLLKGMRNFLLAILPPLPIVLLTACESQPHLTPGRGSPHPHTALLKLPFHHQSPTRRCRPPQSRQLLRFRRSNPRQPLYRRHQLPCLHRLYTRTGSTPPGRLSFLKLDVHQGYLGVDAELGATLAQLPSTNDGVIQPVQQLLEGLPAWPCRTRI